MESLVIIPTYNEKENIREIVSAVLALNKELHILIVDDNSPDGTGEIADELAGQHTEIHVLHRSGKMGLGRAYIDGFKYALDCGAENIFEMDCDFSHDPAMLPGFLEKIQECDLVIGSRYLKGVRVNNWTFKRLLLSKMANVYVNIIANIPRRIISDSTSGFRCFRSTVLKNIQLDKIHSNGYSFQIEMTYKTFIKGFKIAEIPIMFNERSSGESKMDLKIVWEAIWMPWRLRFGFWRCKEAIKSLLYKRHLKKVGHLPTQHS